MHILSKWPRLIDLMNGHVSKDENERACFLHPVGKTRCLLERMRSRVVSS